MSGRVRALVAGGLGRATIAFATMSYQPLSLRPMTDDELKLGLAARSALVVHFSHHSLMDADRPLYPLDMQTALSRNGDFALSCTVVWPGHAMKLVGSVGIVFDPTADNVLSVCPEDSGSSSGEDGCDRSAGVSLSTASFESTFGTTVDRYNEWRVRGALVRGMFVADQCSIEVKKPLIIDIEGHRVDAHAPQRISLDEVAVDFPGMPIFTMGQDGPVRLR